MDEKRDVKRTSLKEWIALITALVALVTVALNFYYTVNKTREQETRIAQLAGCSGITVKITEPSNGEEVEGRIYVNGVATPSEVCQYVFVVVRDKSGAVWKIADLVQANASGQWYGVAQMDDISQLGSDIEIIARVTSRPTDYTVGQFLSTPPMKGISSTNIVRVRRMR